MLTLQTLMPLSVFQRENIGERLSGQWCIWVCDCLQWRYLISLLIFPAFSSTAPEMIDRRGYSWQIDYWSLGITAYECLYSRRPFAHKCKEADTVKESIMRDELRFPREVEVSKEGIAAIAAVSGRGSCITSRADEN